MEVLRLHGYTEVEKLEIARQYLVKKQREATGLTEKNSPSTTTPFSPSFATTRAKPASATWNARSATSAAR
jgi:hypothetical protein